MIETRSLTGADLDHVLDDLAALRITVFRGWPYLYDGDLDYERAYLQVYQDSPKAVVVGAFADGRLIGAATGTPLLDHADDFGAAFQATDIDMTTVFYCAESVLLPQWHGQGIGHRFFDLREAHARDLGFQKVAFCAVVRPPDHPLRPRDARSLDPFWRGRGYAPIPGVVAHFRWKDVDQSDETDKPLAFWSRDL